MSGIQQPNMTDSCVSDRSVTALQSEVGREKSIRENVWCSGEKYEYSFAGKLIIF